ncbi:Imm52 family immunity protein [Streptomyces sp. NPDC004134]|uniref:Imm52 family immunity protein n=1 Tax=Streptomyces sp. NPDC004134 TaxID=3364691 RepID=UPI0036BB3385
MGHSELPFFYLGAYWGMREQTLDDVAGDISATVRALGEAHPALRSWWWEDRAAPVDPDSQWLRDELEAARRRDGDGEPSAGDGYSVSFHNEPFPDYHSGPGSETKVKLSFFAGESGTPRLSNNCVLTLPAPKRAPQGLYDLQSLKLALHWMADIWRPDHALCVNTPLADAQGDWMKVSPQVGWITYLGPKYTDGIERAELPHGVQAAARADGALLWFPLPAADVAPRMVVDLREALVAAGCLPAGNG